MSSFDKRRARYCSKIICVAYASVSVTALVGQLQDARAAVFEQRCNGKVIAVAGGAPVGAPPRQNPLSSPGQAAVATSVLDFGPPAGADASDVPAGDVLAADVAPLSSACANPPAGTPGKGVLALKAIRNDLSLPKPTKLSQDLSGKQREMRELAADVGMRFAGEPGVRKADLDQATFIKLFTTLIHQESYFDPRVVSHVGARGLGQLMPATARYLGVKDSFAPEENLVGAATYLTEMLETFGSPELALAAYNAGPAAVRRYGGIPPYRETRQYVADILHEVLRDPAPTYVTARAGAARSSEPGLEVVVGTDIPRKEQADRPRLAQTDDNPFASVMAGKREKETESPIPQALAFAAMAPVKLVSDQGTREAAIRAGQPTSPQKGKEQKPQPEMAGKGLDLPLPDRAPLPAPRPGSGTVPIPDLALLPAPRPVSGALQKWQITLRDLADETARRHAHAPGIGKAGLSEREFATLFVALIRRESSFNRRAVSRDGAKGLGQLKPETLRELGVKDPFSAKENLEATATHFAALLERFGSPALALAAYDAGPDRVLEEGGIPDRGNTRQFVADVLHDAKSDPRPDFLAARLKETETERHASDEGSNGGGKPDGGMAGRAVAPDEPREELKPAAMAALGGNGPVIGAFIAALTTFLVSMAGALFGRPQRQVGSPGGSVEPRLRADTDRKMVKLYGQHTRS